MRKRDEGDENAWRCRDDYVGTQKRLRRHAVGATSGRSLKLNVHKVKKVKKNFKGKRIVRR